MSRRSSRDGYEQGVPPVAVAGAIADEYNASGWLDSLQDDFIASRPESVFELHRSLNIDSKLLNAFKHDLGPGNIKLETAWSLHERNPGAFPGVTNYGSMVDYVLTDQGTSKLSAMFMSDAPNHYGALLDQLPPELKEAVLVTSYKRGIENYDLATKLREQDPFMPGEGMRVLMQRDDLLRALGLLPPAQDSDGVRVTK